MPEHQDMTPSNERSHVLTDTLKGAVAGAVGVWAMDRADWFMYDHVDPEARRQTQAVRPGGLDPAHVIANRAADAFGAELSPRQPHPAGIAVHYSLGIGPGALYGALQGRVPALATGRGALYGLGLFLIEDELANPVLGLSASPGRYPWQAHARGLVAHLVYGIVTDTVLRLLKGSARNTERRQAQSDASAWSRGDRAGSDASIRQGAGAPERPASVTQRGGSADLDPSVRQRGGRADPA